MHLTRITSARRQGFQHKPLHRMKEKRMSPLAYLSHKSSFLIAAVSLTAFVAGNMIGSHGMYAFWKSVWGKLDDSLIVYDGTVSPVAAVPDYDRWALLGGGDEEHTFRQIPQDLLVSLPPYDPQSLKTGLGKGSEYYEVGYMGSYDVNGDGVGSHPGVDIRAPKDTPVRAIANGIVVSVKEDAGGFGKYVVVRHPNVPDPDHPGKTTVLYSCYAHLDAQLVVEGDILRKGQDLGLVGKTGFATGYHLHFQIDRDTTPDGEQVPWHPYWPFTGEEARQAGLNQAAAVDKGLHQDRGYKYTVHPLLYVQANLAPITSTVAQAGASSSQARISSSVSSQSVLVRLLSMRQARLDQRVIKQQPKGQSSSQVQSPSSITVVASIDPPTDPPVHPSAPTVSGPIASIAIQHDGSFAGRGWETVRLTLLDRDGGTAEAGSLNRDLYLRTALGDAEFRPEILSPLDFRNGTAEVKMLPRGRRTIIIIVQPLGILSDPMKYEGN